MGRYDGSSHNHDRHDCANHEPCPIHGQVAGSVDHELDEIREHAVTWTREWIIAGAGDVSTSPQTKLVAVLEFPEAHAVYVVTFDPQAWHRDCYQVGSFTSEESDFLGSFETLAGAVREAGESAAQTARDLEAVVDR